MGHKARRKPAKLAKKLARIRKELGLSQSGMVRQLGLADEIRQSHISAFELGTREPSLVVLLRYARLAGVTMEILVDDKLKLPAKLPAMIKDDRPPEK
jgi:transcriptional regulator with XRE-family HTH domain